MAGVGFSLRDMRADDSYTGLVRQYGAAGVISSGPWLISILSLLFIGILAKNRVPDPTMLTRFQVSVTWIFAGSLIISGPIQLVFTRFIADLSYANRDDEIFPHLLGALALTSAVSASISCALCPLFASEPADYKILFGIGFIALCNIWVVLVVLTGLREHKQVLFCFTLGYGVTFAATMLLAPWGETGLLFGFVLGQAALLVRSLQVLANKLPMASSLVAFQFLNHRLIHIELLFVGLLYNLGIWIDKLLFWFEPSTSKAVLGPLRASEVYDLPIFLAYLTIVPGMAMFLMHVETSFAEQHRAFYAAIRDGAPLSRIEELNQDLTRSARAALGDILKVQTLTFAICIVAGPYMLDLAGISRLHLPLFYIDSAAVGLQVLLLGITSMFFYLDRLFTVVKLSLLLVLSNFTLTLISQRLGPMFYGYGFALAVGITSIVGLVWLSRTFDKLVRHTFMLQPVDA